MIVMNKTQQTHEKPWYGFKHHHRAYPKKEIITHYGFKFHIRRHLGFLPLSKQVQHVYFSNIYLVIWIGVYNLCTILKKCTTSLKSWNLHYRTECNIQPTNMVHYIPWPSTIFKDILTQNSPIYGSLHTRVHHKYWFLKTILCGSRNITASK